MLNIHKNLGRKNQAYYGDPIEEVPRPSLNKCFLNQRDDRNHLRFLVETMILGSNLDLLYQKFSGSSLKSAYLTEKTKKH